MPLFFLKKITSIFNGHAEDRRVVSLGDLLLQKFGIETKNAVEDIFKKLSIPMPEGDSDYLPAAKGGIVFINRYGIVIRVESKDTQHPTNTNYSADRIADNPWILQPIASLEAGKVIIEVCPGTRFEKNADHNDIIKNQLACDRIIFFDDGIKNIGIMPFSIEEFPDGIPVVIDRLAVRRGVQANAGHNPESVVLKSKIQEAHNILYKPLKEKFGELWKGYSQDMSAFWVMCERYVGEGKLCNGWSDYSRHKESPDVMKQYADGRPLKTLMAAKCADNYEKKFQLYQEEKNAKRPIAAASHHGVAQ